MMPAACSSNAGSRRAGRWAPWLASVLVLLAGASPSQAGALPFHEGPDGVSCRYFDVALNLDWPGGKPGWIDAKGVANGAQAYDAQAVESARGAAAAMRWTLTALVKQWASGAVPNEGLVLKAVGTPGGGAQFHSRESPEIDLRPSLRVSYAGGASELLGAAADAVLDCSTYTGLGQQPRLSISPGALAVFRFDLGKLRKGRAADVKTAELVLLRTEATPWSLGLLGVFRLATPFTAPSAAAAPGLAAAFPGDRGLENLADVLFVDRFDSPRLDPRWSPGDPSVRHALVAAAGRAVDGAPAIGHSLRATIPRGQHLGLDLRYDFKRQRQAEPDEIYLRYYLKLDQTWLDAPDSGKLPGLSGTYGRAGWGGRPWDGALGWSARGAFFKAPSATHPMRGHLALGSYVYHSKSSNGYGEPLSWSAGQGAALLRADRWYCVEQHLKLNAPGRQDGVLRAWVDGHLVFEKSDLRLRDTAQLKIENAWFDLYLGGQEVARQDMSLQISHVVIARKYIGPMAP